MNSPRSGGAGDTQFKKLFAIWSKSNSKFYITKEHPLPYSYIVVKMFIVGQKEPSTISKIIELENINSYMSSADNMCNSFVIGEIDQRRNYGINSYESNRCQNCKIEINAQIEIDSFARKHFKLEKKLSFDDLSEQDEEERFQIQREYQEYKSVLSGGLCAKMSSGSYTCMKCREITNVFSNLPSFEVMKQFKK